MPIKISLIVICIFVTASFSQSLSDSLDSEIKLRTYIENESVPLNREVVYHIELKWKGELSRYKISEIREPNITNLATRSTGSSNKVRTDVDGNLISVKEITFYFKPLEIGMAYVDGVVIRYKDQVKGNDESLISSRIGIKIVEPLPDPEDNNFLSNLLFGLLIILVAGVIVFLFFHYRKKKKEAEEKALSEIKETTEEKYLRLLKETIHLTTDNIKDSLNDLTHLLNGYISEKYHFPVSNLSPKDLLEVLKDKELSEESLSRVNDYYSKAHLVKFAGDAVEDSEFHRLYDTVELFLENQKNTILKTPE